MAAKPWPGPVEVFEQYLRSREAFSHHKATLLDSPDRIDRSSRFWTKTPDEIEDAFREMSAELDIQIVMLLLASCEASLRVDFEKRVRLRLKDSASTRFRDLEQRRKKSKAKKGVRLEDIIKVWSDESAGSSAGPLGKLLLYRHWIAHGRFWVENKSGLNDPDPFEAWNIIRRFFNALPDRDFQRLPDQRA